MLYRAIEAAVKAIPKLWDLLLSLSNGGGTASQIVILIALWLAYFIINGIVDKLAPKISALLKKFE